MRPQWKDPVLERVRFANRNIETLRKMRGGAYEEGARKRAYGRIPSGDNRRLRVEGPR